MKNDQLDQLTERAENAIKRLPKITVGEGGLLFDLETPDRGDGARGDPLWVARELKPDRLVWALGEVRDHLKVIHEALANEPRRGREKDDG